MNSRRPATRNIRARRRDGHERPETGDQNRRRTRPSRNLFRRAAERCRVARDTVAVRAAAFKSFAAAGLPTSRSEAWKYTDLRRLMQDAKPLRAGSGGAGASACARRRRAFRGPQPVQARRYRRLFRAGSFRPRTTWSRASHSLGGESARGRRTAVLAWPGPIVPANEPTLALNAALASRRRRRSLSLLAPSSFGRSISCSSPPARNRRRSTPAR